MVNMCDDDNLILLLSVLILGQNTWMDVDCVILQCQSKYGDGEITIKALSMKKSMRRLNQQEVKSLNSQTLTRTLILR